MLWVLAVVVLVLDQSTKAFIVGWLDWGESWPVEGFLRFTHARNTGTAFSLFQGHSNILSFVAIVAVGCVAVGVLVNWGEVVCVAVGTWSATGWCTWESA